MKEHGVTIQSVERALRILDCFTGREQELGITEIAGRMGLGKSTVYGLVNTLLVMGYLEQDPDSKKYCLGLKLFEMGNIVQRRMDVRAAAGSYLRQLSEETRLTVHMAVYRDGQVIYIDKVDAPDSRIVYSQVGKVAPIYCTGIGKAILAWLPEKERQWLLSGERKAMTPHTIVERAALEAELAEIRKNGYSMDREELEIGLRCVGAPVFDAAGRPIAAISASGTAGNLSKDREKNIQKKICEIALAISAKMGYK